MNDLLEPTADQLRRTAIVYVRQSSPGQVARNVESQELQYELTERAATLGWGRDRIVVIDDDLGLTGSEATNRNGFQRLVAEVGLGHVGVVVGIEVSRLARRNADWYNLMDLCALTNTLIADSDGIYHPGDYNSRLVLGLKGTIAEAELHLIRGRLAAGRRHKAAKGELKILLPVGLDYDEDGTVVLSHDESVHAAISEVFSRFEELTSARQVLLSLRADGLKLPHRAPGTNTIAWKDANYRAVHEILVKPAYAGAYVFGRTRGEKTVEATGRIVTRVRAMSRDEWEICLIGHHPGYIDWDTYLSNQARLTANRRPTRGEAGGAPREGSALLAGLVRCGVCGRTMQVHYWSSGGRQPTYACLRAAYEIGSVDACQRVGGRRVDETVVAAVFEALEPAGLAATAKALAEAEAEHQRGLVAFEAAVERARYEAARARRQFDAVEPENRLVARGLEAAWEARLAEVARSEKALADKAARRPVLLSDEEIAWLKRAGADLRAVFDAETTTMAERKQLLRAVVSEVMITIDADSKTANLRICFEGGAVVCRSVAPPRPGWHIPTTDEDTIELIRRLAGHYDDTRIAQILSRQGRKTAKGLDFTRARVNALRQDRAIPAGPRATDTDGDDTAKIMSMTEACRELGVGSSTIYRWLREGFITGTQLTPGGPWHVRVDDELRARFVPQVPAGWLGLAEAARALGVARQTVLDRVRRGELRAVHVTRGRRSGLAIEVGTGQGRPGQLFA
ncbi:MAG: recombinase family protein [Acidimicrobiales bacterium]